jgi:hypothetical protein
VEKIPRRFLRRRGLQYASPAIMTKKANPNPARGAGSAAGAKPAMPAPPRRGPAASRNPNLNHQTRQVLAQHYRAKYGVK